ncbi:hypothetical protein DL89DRAFT_269647 [Linderina pennispora]|uniref:G-protein coupled receptors family 3 profile domain-containing protein n=1 Tax=Linderina pennispora TaxID=61395 RepID=A0A1Y1W111_9FUNG|nr:uncharacterized protein DL89DRAFT_269647 [Linderina pennispora]ORX67229.1 hypothetical protein DL89DRAFT_269647 [Linderina pennispora]
MSFSITPEKRERAEWARVFGFNSDPIGRVDLATVVVFSCIYSLGLIIMVYLVINRRYPPLRAKGVMFFVLMYLASVMWFIGDLLAGQPLRRCAVNIAWLRASFGAILVQQLVVVRQFSLYYMFVLGRPFRGKVVYITYATVLLLATLGALVITVLPHRMTFWYLPYIDICFVADRFQHAIIVIVWLLWGVVAVVNLQLSRVSMVFGEFRDVVILMAISLITVIVNTVSMLAVQYFPIHLAWRTAVVYTDHICVNLQLYLLLGFHHESYLQYWSEVLIGEGGRFAAYYSTGVGSGGIESKPGTVSSLSSDPYTV